MLFFCMGVGRGQTGSIDAGLCTSRGVYMDLSFVGGVYWGVVYTGTCPFLGGVYDCFLGFLFCFKYMAIKSFFSCVYTTVGLGPIFVFYWLSRCVRSVGSVQRWLLTHEPRVPIPTPNLQLQTHTTHAELQHKISEFRPLLITERC